MLNKIWGGMIVLGVLWGIVFGEAHSVTQSFIDGGKEAITLGISMSGIIAFWMGIMKIAEAGGLTEMVSKKLLPLLKILFPSVPPSHKAMKYIALNFTANFFGLGWAATPAGLMAMEELQKLNRSKDTATDAMCMFLIINISSVQLLCVNILAYRTLYESANPAETIFPSILATCVSTFVGVAVAKICQRRCK
ncbi:MAG: nucleoside recognition domain-containing protein [Anaerotignaceae bacterium]